MYVAARFIIRWLGLFEFVTIAGDLVDDFRGSAPNALPTVGQEAK
jgi:hypothetical protein